MSFSIHCLPSVLSFDNHNMGGGGGGGSNINRNIHKTKQ